MSTRETTKMELEAMLDGGHSIADVLSMLAEVCDEKAEHVRTNWQDKVLAREWTRASTKLHGMSRQNWPV